MCLLRVSIVDHDQVKTEIELHFGSDKDFIKCQNSGKISN